MNFRLLSLLVFLPALHASDLYTTEFEDFPAGPNNWAGTDGWISNDATSGAQAIDIDIIPGGGLGNTASLGYQQPASLFTTVARFFNYDHVATGLPLIEIDCLLGIEDSDNGHRDDFYLSIYNNSGILLASIRFDNQDPAVSGSQFGFWREDGVRQFDTLVDFSHGQLYNLYVLVDLSRNTWSADIGGFPLFTDSTFTSNATDAELNFGALAFEWGLSATGTAGFGNNFLVLADVSVHSVPQGVTPFAILAARDPGTAAVTISWQADAGFDYQIEVSNDLLQWFDTLPGASLSGVTATAPMSYTDTTAPQGTAAYYRVTRTESP